MSINRNRRELEKLVTRKEVKCRIQYQDPYYEDIGFRIPNYRKGYRHGGKYMYRYQQRMYKTWKHTRKTQYK